MLNEGHLANFAQNWLSWQRPLRNQKETRIKKYKQMPTILSKIVTIGPVDAEICLNGLL